MAWQRYVAVGDSFTEGVGDPGPDGGLTGWADRLAALLSAAQGGVEYANLAVRGRLLGQVVDEQLPAALALRFASHVGLALTGATVLLFLYVMGSFVLGRTVQGWTSTMLVVLFLGSVQMFVLGMIGEYLGRLYVESKRRPLYLVADIAGPVIGRASLGYRAGDGPRPVRPEPAEGLLVASAQDGEA